MRPTSPMRRPNPASIAAALLGAALALTALPNTAMAQMAPDSPRMVSPRGPSGLGVYWLQPDVLPDDGNGVLATWAFPGLPDGLRLRGGAGRGYGDDEAAFGGLDYQTALARSRPGLPFDIDWQMGAGVGFGNHVLVSLPLGLSAGVEWTSGRVWLAPYVTTGVVADLHLGDDWDGEELEIDPALDFGLDLSLDPGRNFVIRAAASLGDRQAIAVGAAIGGGAGTRN